MQPQRAESFSSSKCQVAWRGVERMVSGGQTGADRAALDFARSRGIPHSGWCPQGRLAEDGVIDNGYALHETPTPYYPERTEWNVRDSDATVIFSITVELSGGSRATADFAAKLEKPCLHISRMRDGHRAAERLREFLTLHRVRVLNVAGPRASNEPDVAEFVREVLEDTLVENERSGE